MEIRRVASNIVIDEEGRKYKNHVIELYDSHVVNLYPLKGEIPMTEWLGGTIIIENHKAFKVIINDGEILHKQQL